MTQINTTPKAISDNGNGHPFAPLVARVRSFGLDRDLAQGVDPSRTPAHTARARQLTSDRTRKYLARGLERIAEEPTTGRRYTSNAVNPSRASVRATRPQLVELSARLRTADNVDPRAVAALRGLLTDGAGPLYNDGNVELLRQQLENIDSWLVVSEN